MAKRGMGIESYVRLALWTAAVVFGASFISRAVPAARSLLKG